VNLKSMSLDLLVALKGKVEAALNTKVADERRMLQAGLSKLDRFQSGGSKVKAVFGRSGARNPVAPKYRNPENAAETWAGRGLKPRWLSAAIKSGKKQDDFLIAGAAPVSKVNGRKKTRKAHK